jgi:hypothetical protein
MEWLWRRQACKATRGGRRKGFVQSLFVHSRKVCLNYERMIFNHQLLAAGRRKGPMPMIPDRMSKTCTEQREEWTLRRWLAD